MSEGKDSPPRSRGIPRHRAREEFHATAEISPALERAAIDLRERNWLLSTEDAVAERVDMIKQRPLCAACNQPLVTRRRLYSTVYDHMCVNEDCAEHHNRVAPPPAEGSGDFSIGATVWPGVSKLSEEAGEVAECLAEAAVAHAIGRLGQVTGKLLGAAGSVDHWDGDGPLDRRLESELADLLGAIDYLLWANPRLKAGAIESQRQTKFARFKGWHEDGPPGVRS